MARLHSAEQEEVQRILRASDSAIQAESEALTAALQGVGRLDLLCARKRFAVRFDAVRPAISEPRQCSGNQCPVIRCSAQEEGSGGVVPLHFVLPDETRVVLISGPNAGGKTVAMKTLGSVRTADELRAVPARGRRQRDAAVRADLRRHRRRAVAGR